MVARKVRLKFALKTADPPIFPFRQTSIQFKQRFDHSLFTNVHRNLYRIIDPVRWMLSAT